MESVAPILLALLATIMIEIAVLLLLGEKRRKVLLASVVINVITNVPLNIIAQYVGLSTVGVIIGELIVVAVEALWYYLFVKKASQAMVYSLLCNAISFLIGLICTTLPDICYHLA